MLIDWFTVCAQALNFLVLVWLMKRFLYKPVLHAVDVRETLIAKELADAAKSKAEARKERDIFQQKSDAIDQHRVVLMSKATEEVKGERQRLLDEAHRAADTLTAKQRQTLRNDAHSLNHAISQRTQQEVFAITRRALADLATTSLEERMGEVFTRRLREMEANSKETLGKALKTVSAPGVIRSTFDLPSVQRAAIQNALNETFSAEIQICFETVPDLVCGIELNANGQKVAWSISNYLVSLENDVAELLKEKGLSEASADYEKSRISLPCPETDLSKKPQETPLPKPACGPDIQ